MPTLDPPGMDWGGTSERIGSGRRRHPVALAVLTFIAALVTTVLVLLLAGSMGR